MGKKRKVTYGIQKEYPHGGVSVMIWDQTFVNQRFIGPGGYKPKEWRTRKGAERAAARLYQGLGATSVFEIK